MIPNHLATSMGNRFEFEDPKPEDIELQDLVYGMATHCRFNGQIRREFVLIGGYSVLQHSVHMTEQCLKRHGNDEDGKALAQECLMHDAAEGLLGDMPTPIKRRDAYFTSLDHKLDKVIRAKWDLPVTMSPEVVTLDQEALATEIRDVVPLNTADWPELPDPWPMLIEPMSCKAVIENFWSMAAYTGLIEVR